MALGSGGMSRARRGALFGAFWSAGAPIGLLLVRGLAAGTLDAAFVMADLRAEAWSYAYVAASTAVAFTLLGFILGRQADQFFEASTSDPLTGLRNRRALRESLVREWARARRYQTPLSVLAIDLDGLKVINDSLGHRAGDAAIDCAAQALVRNSRQADTAARWGGDEFLLLAPETDRAEALRLGERVRAVCTEQAQSGIGRRLTLSIGVATRTPGSCSEATELEATEEELLRAADQALYQAKRAGGNCVTAAE